MKINFVFKIAVIFLLYSLKSYSQQDPMYSMYMFDKMLINPAYTGSSNWIVGTMKYRTQFVGLEGAPVTQTLNFHLPIQKKHIGLGFKVIRDNIAVSNSINATGTFSYHLGLAGGKLSAGIEGGIYNHLINYSSLIKSDNNDNALPLTKESVLVPDASFGLYYQKRNFYLGGSITHLIGMPMNFNDYTRNPQAHLYKHYFILTGIVLDMGKNFAIEPSILLKNVQGAPTQLDLNCNLVFKERITLGASFRTGDAVSAILKINITDDLRIGYSYDYTLSKLAKYSNGAHEVMLSYGIKLLPPPAEKEIHPRYYF